MASKRNTQEYPIQVLREKLRQRYHWRGRLSDRNPLFRRCGACEKKGKSGSAQLF